MQLVELIGLVNPTIGRVERALLAPRYRFVPRRGTPLGSVTYVTSKLDDQG
jgi:hypothetical protein